mgnify:CR=1 FL=1
MKITFLGGGNMANALIAGLLRQGQAVADILVIEPDAHARERLAATYGISCLAGPEPRAWAADIIVLAVKPQQMQAAVQPLAASLTRQIVVSIAAGLSLAVLSRWLGGYRRIVRCMPNTPSMIGAGVTGLCALPEVAAEERQAAERVMQAAGSTLWLDDEVRMDALTAVSGSGPAYVFLFIEAMQQAACELGLTTLQARQLALETVLGATRLAEQSAESPTLLRERVTSKGGTTEAALRVMTDQGVREGIVAGIHAACQRSAELGRQLGGE